VDMGTRSRLERAAIGLCRIFMLRSPQFGVHCASNHCAHWQNAPPSAAAMTSDNGVGRIAREDGVSPMKTILSALLALSVLAGFAGAAAANVDAKTFYEQVDRDRF